MWLHNCSIILFAWPQHLHPTHHSLFASLKHASLFPRNSTSSPLAKQTQNSFPRPGKCTIFNWIISWSKIYTSVLAEAEEPEAVFPKQMLDYKQRSDLPSLNPQQLHQPEHRGWNSWVSRLTPGLTVISIVHALCHWKYTSYAVQELALIPRTLINKHTWLILKTTKWKSPSVTNPAKKCFFATSNQTPRTISMQEDVSSLTDCEAQPTCTGMTLMD